MLREISAVRQVPGTRLKQWFTDDVLDLFVWRDAQGHIEKFQLTCKVGVEAGVGRERALTWSARDGFAQHRVDDGEQRPDRYKATPILIPSAHAPLRELAGAFSERADALDPDIRELVSRRLDELHADCGNRP